ncbi:MAG: WecB/TagA/CpsF family glycosyltransferase [Bacteroidota bacterium]
MFAIEKKTDPYPVLGVDIAPYSKDEFYYLIGERLKDDDLLSPPIFVVTVNPEIAIQSIFDNQFKEILSKSTINTADGVGISWAIHFLHNKTVDRITGSDSLERICNDCATYGQTVFFYGAAPGVAQQAADILMGRIEDLSVIGTHSPEKPDMAFEQLPMDTQILLKSASVIFVALGAPAQEKWIHANLDKLPNCKLIIGIGGSFDFISGSKKRAPEILRKSGLEWMFRLWLEPARWHRMLKLPLFALNVLMLRSSIHTTVKNGESLYLKEDSSSTNSSYD